MFLGDSVKKTDNSKINTYLLCGILVALVILIVILLSKKDDKNKISIIGTWKTNVKKETEHLMTDDGYIFNEDKTCVNVYKINDNEYSSTCEYKITNDKLIITFTDDNFWEEEDGVEIKTKSFSYVLNEDSLSFGDEIYYKK